MFTFFKFSSFVGNANIKGVMEGAKIWLPTVCVEVWTSTAFCGTYGRVESLFLSKICLRILVTDITIPYSTYCKTTPITAISVPDTISVSHFRSKPYFAVPDTKLGMSLVDVVLHICSFQLQNYGMLMGARCEKVCDFLSRGRRLLTDSVWLLYSERKVPLSTLAELCVWAP